MDTARMLSRKQATTNAPVLSENRRADKRKEIIDFLIAISALGDGLMISAGLLLGFWVRFKSGWFTIEREYFLSEYSTLILLGIAFCEAMFLYLRLYEGRHLLRFRRAASIIFRGCTIWLGVYLGLSLAFKVTPPISRLYVLFSWLFCVLLLLGWRALFSRLVHWETLAKNLRQRILLVGWGTQAKKFNAMIHSDPTHPYEIVGCIPAFGHFDELPPRNIPVWGNGDDIPLILEKKRADIVVLADINAEMKDIISLSNQCEKSFVQFKVIPSYFQILATGLHLENISGVPILGVTELPLDGAMNRIMKRCVDIVGAIVGLTLSAPIMGICGALIYLESPGPIFFGQERMGRNGRRFKMYKLRSMRIGADKHDHLNQSTLREDPRVLRCGAFMRRWNLDEVPQFWNVFNGDMSLVGPRPERTFHSEKLSGEIPHYNARYGSKPGITGWAQIHGLRGDTSLVERIQYDLYYLENWSLLLDVQIMVLTFFKRDNAY